MIQKEIVSTYSNRILNNLLYQGFSNDCGPYSATTVIKSIRNLDPDPKRVASELNKPSWRSFFPIIRRIPNFATFPWGMVDLFNRYGIHARWRCFIPFSYLQENLEREKIFLPVIASLHPFWAHIMILIALHPIKGCGFANTQFANHEIYWVPLQQFRQQWRLTLNCVIEVHSFSFPSCDSHIGF